MKVCSCARLFFLVASSVLLNAQEVKYVDLTSVVQRIELRRPPAPPLDCASGNCVGGGHAGISIGDGAPDRRDPHALGIYLLKVSPTEINPELPFEVEFKVLNTGLAPIELPVSPHLSDLQPADESAPFTYSSLSLVARVESDLHYTSCLGWVELYGSPDHDGTLLTLKPGEWIRVKADVKLNSSPTKQTSAGLKAEFWLRKNTWHPHAGGGFTDMQNQYPNVTPTPPVEVRFVSGSETPKQ